MDREELTGRLRAMKYLNVALYETAGVAADLIDQQAARIVELEAERDRLRKVLDTFDSNIGKVCKAKQYSDIMKCSCGLEWDMNDPSPPKCAERK